MERVAASIEREFCFRSIERLAESRFYWKIFRVGLTISIAVNRVQLKNTVEHKPGFGSFVVVFKAFLIIVVCFTSGFLFDLCLQRRESEDFWGRSYLVKVSITRNFSFPIWVSDNF